MCWGTAQITAFQKAKDALQLSSLLVHYDSGKLLTLACDASPYGIEAVLSHKFTDGYEKPVDFASRTLSSAKNTTHNWIKKPWQSFFGIKKFHDYLQGHHFAIYFDHQPLQYLLSESKAIPIMASERLK